MSASDFLYAFFAGFSEDEVIFERIFIGFAESRPWECRFSRSKLHAHHKSLVFFRSLLLPAVDNLMCCAFFCMFCISVCDSVLMCCSLWQGVLESS